MPLCAEINSRTKVIADCTGFTVLIDNEYEHIIEFNILLKLKKGMSQSKIEELLFGEKITLEDVYKKFL